MWRDDAYLLDMLLYARRAQAFCTEATLEEFMADLKLQAATLHVLQTVGEAAAKVSETFRQAHPEIPWNRIINLRHRLAHDYPRIELPRIWNIVQHHIPPLIAALDLLVPPETPDHATEE